MHHVSAFTRYLIIHVKSELSVKNIKAAAERTRLRYAQSLLVYDNQVLINLNITQSYITLFGLEFNIILRY